MTSIIPHPLDDIAATALNEDVPPDDRPVFRVGDDGGAAWAMERLDEAVQEINAALGLYIKQKARLDEWLHHAKADAERRRVYFEGLLTDYAVRQREERDRKSIVLPHGRVTTRLTTMGVEFSDEAKFVDWASTHQPELVKTTVKPSVSAIKQAFKAAPIEGGFAAVNGDGEVIPFVWFTEPRVSVTVSPEHAPKEDPT